MRLQGIKVELSTGLDARGTSSGLRSLWCGLMRPARGAVGLLAALVLVACSSGAADEPQPTTSAPAATSKAPTPTATESTPAPPEMPPEAREGTPEGAEAFARYWFDAVEHAYRTGDPSILRQLAEPDCVTCTSLIEEVEREAANGRSFEGIDVEVLTSVAGPPDERGVVVSMTLREADSRVIASDGSVIREVPGTEATAVDVYVSRGDEWKIFGVGLAS